MASDSAKFDVRTHTALHVLKGAVVKVLGKDALWTASTYVDGSHGRLTVKFIRKPSPEEMERIEEEANRKIAEDVQVRVVELNRDEAERRYGNIIYDLYPIPSSVKRLKIVIIDNWNINACNKPHLTSTGGIGRLVIRKWRFRKSKELLEISFDVVRGIDKHG